MDELKISVAEIKDLITSVKESGIEGVKISQGDFSLNISGTKKQLIIESPAASTQQIEAFVVEETVSNTPSCTANGTVVASPIVGTFYSSSSPDKAPYIKIGDKVKEGDILFIVESMKLMNEVLCETSGTVTEIYLKNEETVEYGQPVLVIE